MDGPLSAPRTYRGDILQPGSPIFVSRAQPVRECFPSVLSRGTLVLSFIHPKDSSMGSKWFTGGVVAAGRGRIRFDFTLDGIRYRPTIKRPPSEANLRRARE